MSVVPGNRTGKMLQYCKFGRDSLFVHPISHLNQSMSKHDQNVGQTRPAGLLPQTGRERNQTGVLLYEKPFGGATAKGSTRRGEIPDPETACETRQLRIASAFLESPKTLTSAISDSPSELKRQKRANNARLDSAFVANPILIGNILKC